MYPNVFADEMECKAVHQWGKKYSSNPLKCALSGLAVGFEPTISVRYQRSRSLSCSA